MRSDEERLQDILEAITRIQRYAVQGRPAFDQDELIQTWIVHHLQLIGEASRAISDAFRDAHSEIPWHEIVGMRNILVHHYFGVDKNVVWSVVENDLPPIEASVRKALAGN